MANPKNPLYWNELGIAHHSQAQLEQALKCYQKAAKVDPHYADAQNNIGTVLYERKKFEGHPRLQTGNFIRDNFAPFYLNLLRLLQRRILRIQSPRSARLCS
jgi:tetratricopeptide (TPR) repeat protein